MVHGFAKQSGGNLHISSEPGKGTSVEVWLPLVSRMLMPRQRALRGDRADRGSRNVAG